MGDDRSEIARTDGQAGFVTYSRIEPRDDKSARQGPILDGIEVPAGASDEMAPDVRADARVVPSRRGGGRAFAVFAVVALVAFAGGVGVLAGSFLLPTVGTVVPVPGGGKAAAVVVDSENVLPMPKQAEAQSSGPAEKVDADRFAAAHAPAGAASTVATAAGSRPASEVQVVPAPKKVAAEPAPTPVPRTRPEPVVATAPMPDPTPVHDPLAMPPEAAATDIAALPTPAPSAPPYREFGPPMPSSRQSGSELPTSPQPDVFRADEINDPLAPPPVVPDQTATGHVPPAEIPERDGYGYDPDFPHDGVAPVEDWSETYQSALDHWIVLDVRNGQAIIDGRERGVFMVVEGSDIPGVGIVEDIKRRKGRWTVVTTGGSIYSSLERGERRRFWLSRLFRD